MLMEKFNYDEAIVELEKIALTLEDPATPIADLDELTSRAALLVERCRNYLRECREKTELS